MKDMRTFAETKRIFDRYVLPQRGNCDIDKIDREMVRTLLNTIHDKKVEAEIKGNKRSTGSPVVATATLVQLGALFSWYARYNEFQSPIVSHRR